MTEKKSNLSRPAQSCLKLVMVLVAPLLMLCILEGTGYVWEKAQGNGKYAWELVASRRIAMNYFSSPGDGYSLMKPDRHYEYQGIPVDINEKGLRNPQVDYAKPEGEFRILNLGDSVAMGWGVGQEETYGQLLAGLLASKINHPVEVINAGVPGWNLENEWAFLVTDGIQYNPDLVLLDFTLPNDVYGASVLQTQTKAALVKWLRDNTYFWPFLTIQFRWIEAKVKGNARIEVLNPPRIASAYFPEDQNNPKWDQIKNTIQKIRAITQERNIPMILLLFPLEFQVYDDDYSTLPQEVLRTWADQEGIPSVDLLQVYRKACELKPGGRCMLEDRYLFADVWMHPSALGHRIASQEILNAILNIK